MLSISNHQCKFKLCCMPHTSHPSGWLLFRWTGRQKTANVGRVWRNRRPGAQLVECGRVQPCGNLWITISSSNSTLAVYPRSWKGGSHPSSGQHHSQKPKGGSNPDIHQQVMDKQNILHPHDRVLFSTQRQEPLTPATAWMDLEDIVPSGIHQSQRANPAWPLRWGP